MPSNYKHTAVPRDVFQGNRANAAPRSPAGSRTSSAAPAAGCPGAREAEEVGLEGVWVQLPGGPRPRVTFQAG